MNKKLMHNFEEEIIYKSRNTEVILRTKNNFLGNSYLILRRLDGRKPTHCDRDFLEKIGKKMGLIPSSI